MPYILNIDEANSIISITDRRTNECIISGELKHNIKSIRRIRDMLYAANTYIHTNDSDEK